MDHSDQNVFDNAMALLRRYGWDVGYRKLKEWLPATADEPTQSLHRLFLGWQALERGRVTESIEEFGELVKTGRHAPWSSAGLGFAAFRQKRFQEAIDCFAQARGQQTVDDQDLNPILCFGEGNLAYQQGHLDRARELFIEAIQICGEDHFLSGRVYDSLGSTWSIVGNFFYAIEFYHRALSVKQRSLDGNADLAGLAVTHGQLGRLYLDWGLLDRAEAQFREDLKICDRLDDPRGRAQMLNHLGQVLLIRAERAFAEGSTALGNSCLTDAQGWLDSSIRAAESQTNWQVLEGYSRKDRALVSIWQKDFESAYQDLKCAEELFHGLNFAEGLAHVGLARGTLARRRQESHESLRLLNKAYSYFSDTQPFMTAKTLLEIARTRRDAGETCPVVTSAYVSALDHAETSRRSFLVQEIERDLNEINPLERLKREYQRARGRLVVTPTSSLIASERETATVLYLDIQGSTQFVRKYDPEEVQLILNQMMADLVNVLRKYHGQVSSYRGDGFLALFRGVESGASHALRAVCAAFDLMDGVKQSNKPRRLLGLSALEVRIGIATGELCFGNVGTYDKMDYTVVGNAANLGARLEPQARTDAPCISDQTKEALGSRFLFSEGAAELRGFGYQRFWYVLGLNPAGLE